MIRTWAPLRHQLSTQWTRAYSTACMKGIEADDLFHRIDLRVGKIVKVDSHPEASHLYVEQVHVDNETEPRTIVSGLAPYMPKEALLHKHVVVVANMKPSRFRGILSQGMLLAASITKDESTRVELLHPPETSVVGERVQLDGCEPLTTPDAVLKPKQRVFEQVAVDLKTDQSRVATYKGHALVTKAGPVTCNTITNGSIS